MDEILDIIWQKILLLVHYFARCLDYILAPLNSFGPAVKILVIVLVTVAVTKFLSKIYKTKRYIELQKDFRYWYNLRKDALASKDPEQGKALAKNIDQAELNKVYYDFFFEGLLSSLLTKYLPILTMAAYVNEAFKPDNFVKNFGRDYVFRFINYDGKVILIGAVFWFVLSMILVYFAWFIIERIYAKYKKTEKQTA